VYSRQGFERIAHRVGISAARFLFLTGRVVEAERAFGLGLIDLLEPDAEATAMALARELAAASPVAIRGTKVGLGLLQRASPEAVAHFERLRLESYSSEDTRARLKARVTKAK
jgi:enoyl-CoA hydratase/carnithine racemase